ncbi:MULTISPECIES: helix-turn-helix transcriptional regulator [unclassified Legionella]|uniref:helix-turn-helix transcriptional regulator n=1 Tax=unclassified Legionella TaxID=2622702 RepID=UPI001E366C10|nr:helix-turn-helix transcriptional regulator [Legionella sp. 31fI33]MCC5014692.1 helix-turn-helix transcriptional regulator [Legionella sp. 31fI33]
MGKILAELQRHPTLLYTEELKNLCKPLESIDITTFSHVRVYNDQRLTVLCNHPDFMINYAKRKYYDADPCINIKPETIDFGQYLVWDAVECYGKTAAMMQDAADFDFKHIFTIIKSQTEFTDFYHFGTHLLNQSINQIYINNLDLLTRFISFFDKQVNQERELARAYKIVFNPDKEKACVSVDPSNFIVNKHKKRNAFLKALAISDNKKLTAKDKICADLLIQGKTVKEIAQLTERSCRTIEDRVDSLKYKFNAKNRTELVVKLLAEFY